MSAAIAGARRPVARRVAGYLRPYRGAFTMALGQMFVISAFELAKPWPLKIVVDSVLGDAPVEIPFFTTLAPEALLLASCAGLVAIHAVVGTLAWWNNRTTITIGQRMVNDLRSDLFEHLQRLSLAFHANRQVGDLLYRLTADTFSIQAFAMNGIFPIANAAVFVIGMTFILLHLDPALACVALLVCPILYLTIRRMSDAVAGQSTIAREEESDVYTIVQRSLSAIRVVQAFTREDEEHRRFVDQSRDSLAASRSVYLLQTLYAGVVNTIIAAGTALVLWIGARRVIEGSMSVGDVLVFLGYLTSLYQPVNAVSQTIGVIQGAKAGILRVFEILDEPETVLSGPRRLEQATVAGEVRFEAVDFAYDSSRRVLESVSLTVPAGTSIALVGPTGAGKTTLASLLPRFYDPQAGRILLDGVDLRELDLGDLRRRVAMVLQPPIVFPATLRENIAYGRAGADPAAIERAAELAQLGPLLDRLPQGLDTMVGESGATISEGEKQRLTIARALLRDARILILDEPTASLDAETEALLMSGLRSLMSGRTTFLIAHRLATVRDADQIVVLRDGRIVESGSYATLVAKNGFFTRLVHLQHGIRAA